MNNQPNESENRRDKMVEKVRALLAKAASSEHPPEAEAFEKKAMQIMAEYEIAERELRDVGSYGDGFEMDLTHFGNAGKGAAALAIWIHELFGGYGVWISRGDGKAGRCKIYATPSHREQASLLLDHLLPQLRDDLTRDRPRSRKSYSLGWASRVAARLRELQQVVYSESNALVPTNSAAREAYEAENGKASQARTRINGSDSRAGEAAGNAADLNQSRVTS